MRGGWGGVASHVLSPFSSAVHLLLLGGKGEGDSLIGLQLVCLASEAQGVACLCLSRAEIINPFLQVLFSKCVLGIQLRSQCLHGKCFPD